MSAVLGKVSRALLLCCVVALWPGPLPACSAWAGQGAADDAAGELPGQPIRSGFLVLDVDGYALLGPDGRELERFGRAVVGGPGAVSPDGQWLLEARGAAVFVQSRVDPHERVVLTTSPWSPTAPTFRPLWSRDSRHLLSCEQSDFHSPSQLRVFDLATRRHTTLKLSGVGTPSGWSADGKRVLATLRGRTGAWSLAWLNSDGTGNPEFVTGENESSLDGCLSPDGLRLLCKVVPGPIKGERRRSRLNVIDLATGTRTIVDRPGVVTSSCWSSDGRQVAYTWQSPLPDPTKVLERRTFLVTCDPDGGNRRTVTLRTANFSEEDLRRDEMPTFFFVFAWWR